MMHDWEFEEFNARYEAFEKICGRVIFWTIVVLIIGGIIVNMAMLTYMVKAYHDSVYVPGKLIEARFLNMQHEL